MSRLSIVPLALLIASVAGAAEPPRDPILENCLIVVEDEVKLPAQEPGVLIELNVEEGQRVHEGDLLGRIDESDAQIMKRQALAEQSAALEQAGNDINVRYATAAAKVAEAEYDQALQANAQVASAIAPAEVRRLKLAWHKAALQIEQSQLEQRMAAFTVKSKAAEVAAAENKIRRAQLIAPFDGEITELHLKKGEWVNPGDPVMRIVRFDTLRVEGFVNAKQYDPGEIIGQPVTVEVELARGRRVRQTGKIVLVNSEVQGGGDYRVEAEIANHQENGQWVFRPGLTAAMRIHLKDAPPVAQAK
jgi:multidrug resistance efflux pump